MDSDDAILPEAFQNLYEIAEEFQADIVHCDNCYQAPGETVSTDKNIITEQIRVAERFEKPILITEDYGRRIEKFISYQVKWEPWTHLIRREFILINDLKFSKLSVADDRLFSLFMWCLAEKIVLTSNAFYVWRVRANSNCREVLSVEKTVHRRLGDVFKAIELIDEFVSKISFFNEQPQYKWALFDFYVRNHSIALNLYSQIPAYKLDILIRNELMQMSNTTALAAFLYGEMSIFNIDLIQQQNLIRQQQQQIQQLQAQLGQISKSEDIFRL